VTDWSGAEELVSYYLSTPN